MLLMLLFISIVCLFDAVLLLYAIKWLYLHPNDDTYIYLDIKCNFLEKVIKKIKEKIHV